MAEHALVLVKTATARVIGAYCECGHAHLLGEAVISARETYGLAKITALRLQREHEEEARG